MARERKGRERERKRERERERERDREGEERGEREETDEPATSCDWKSPAAVQRRFWG